MITPAWDGHVKDGNLIVRDRETFLLHLQSPEGKIVEVIVRLYVRRRSQNQNAYLGGVVYKLIADHTGSAAEEIHDACKLSFGPKKFISNLVAPVTTKRLDTTEFTEYIEKVRRWASEELGVVIPDPTTVDDSSLSQTTTMGDEDEQAAAASDAAATAADAEAQAQAEASEADAAAAEGGAEQQAVAE